MEFPTEAQEASTNNDLEKYSAQICSPIFLESKMGKGIVLSNRHTTAFRRKPQQRSSAYDGQIYGDQIFQSNKISMIQIRQEIVNTVPSYGFGVAKEDFDIQKGRIWKSKEVYSLSSYRGGTIFKKGSASECPLPIDLDGKSHILSLIINKIEGVILISYDGSPFIKCFEDVFFQQEKLRIVFWIGPETKISLIPEKQTDKETLEQFNNYLTRNTKVDKSEQKEEEVHSKQKKQLKKPKKTRQTMQLKSTTYSSDIYYDLEKMQRKRMATTQVSKKESFAGIGDLDKEDLKDLKEEFENLFNSLKDGERNKKQEVTKAVTREMARKQKLKSETNTKNKNQINFDDMDDDDNDDDWFKKEQQDKVNDDFDRLFTQQEQFHQLKGRSRRSTRQSGYIVSNLKSEILKLKDTLIEKDEEVLSLKMEISSMNKSGISSNLPENNESSEKDQQMIKELQEQLNNNFELTTKVIKELKKSKKDAELDYESKVKYLKNQIFKLDDEFEKQRMIKTDKQKIHHQEKQTLKYMNKVQEKEISEREEKQQESDQQIIELQEKLKIKEELEEKQKVEIEDLNKKIKKTKRINTKKMKKFKKQVQELENSTNQLKNDNDSKDMTIIKYKTKASMANDLEKKISTLEKELSKLKKLEHKKDEDNLDITMELKGQKQTNKILNEVTDTRIHKLQHQIDCKDETIEKMKSDNDQQIKKIIEEFELIEKNLKSQIENLKIQIKEKDTEISTQSKEIEKLEDNNQQFSDYCDNNLEIINQHEEEIEGLLFSLQSQELVLSMVRGESDMLTMSSNSQNIEQKSKEIKQKEGKKLENIQQAMIQMEEKIRNKLADLHMEITKQCNKDKDLIERLSEDIGNLRKEQDQLYEKSQEQNKQISDHKTQIKIHEDHIKLLQEEKNNYQKLVTSGKSIDIKNLSEMITSLEEELEMEKRKNSEMEIGADYNYKEQLKLNALIKDYQSENATNAQKVDAQKYEISKLKSKIKKLEIEIEEQNVNYKNLETKLYFQRKKSIVLEKQQLQQILDMGEQSSQISLSEDLDDEQRPELQRSKTSETCKFEVKSRKQQKQKVKLSQMVKTLKKKNTSLQKQKNQLQKEKNSLEEKVSQLEDKVQDLELGMMFDVDDEDL